MDTIKKELFMVRKIVNNEIHLEIDRIDLEEYETPPMEILEKWKETCLDLIGGDYRIFKLTIEEVEEIK